MTDRLSDNLMPSNPFKAGDFSPEKKVPNLKLAKLQSEINQPVPKLGESRFNMTGFSVKRDALLKHSISITNRSARTMRRVSLIFDYSLN